MEPMKRGRLALLAICATIGILGTFALAGLAADLSNYTPVTDSRLSNPEPENWLLIRRTYNGWGYSPLDQINRDNVKNLVPVWLFSTGVTEGHESPPIVNNGIMFVSTPQAQVIALDAKTGTPSGAIASNCQKTCFSCIRPIAASRFTTTRFTSPLPTRT